MFGEVSSSIPLNKEGSISRPMGGVPVNYYITVPPTVMILSPPPSGTAPSPATNIPLKAPEVILTKPAHLPAPVQTALPQVQYVAGSSEPAVKSLAPITGASTLTTDEYGTGAYASALPILEKQTSASATPIIAPSTPTNKNIWMLLGVLGLFTITMKRGKI